MCSASSFWSERSSLSSSASSSGVEPLGLVPARGEGVQHAVPELHQGLRRCACHLDVASGEVEHVGRRVGGPQHPVDVQQASVHLRLQTVGEHDLEDVALADVLLGPHDHGAVLLLGEERCEVGSQPDGDMLPGLPVLYYLHHGVDDGARLRVVPPAGQDVGYDRDRLPEVVEGDHLVEEHQIGVLEPLVVSGVYPQAGLCVLDVVVGEVSDQAAGERWHVLHSRAPVAGQHVPDHVRGMLVRDDLLPFVGRHGHCSLGADDVQKRVEPQERVPSPALPVLDALQDVAVAVDPEESVQNLYGCPDVRQYGTGHRNRSVSLCGEPLRLFLHGAVHLVRLLCLLHLYFGI